MKNMEERILEKQAMYKQAGIGAAVSAVTKAVTKFSPKVGAQLGKAVRYATPKIKQFKASAVPKLQQLKTQATPVIKGGYNKIKTSVGPGVRKWGGRAMTGLTVAATGKQMFDTYQNSMNESQNNNSFGQ